MSGSIISVADASIREGTSTDSVMNFVVTLSAPSLSDVTFTYQTFSGTAQSGDDFSGKSGTGKIPAGQTSATIGITTAHDGTDETDQNFTLELTNPKNATFAGNATALRANGVILDDDGTGSNLALFVSNPILLEGAGGSALARFDVTLSRPAATAITVPYTTADGSATAGSDYTATSGSLTFAPGQTTATVDVPVAGDTTVEPTENFSLVVTPTEVIVGGASDAVGVATILDDDAGGSARPTLSVADASIREGTSTDSVMNFVVTLSAPSLSDVTFTYQTFSGTAQSGDDFSGKSGTGTIPAGQTSATIGITTAHDGTDETDQNFTLELTNPKNATFAGNATALRANGVILDDDGTGSNLALFVSNPILLEGAGGSALARFDVTLSRPAATAITVPYTTADGSATAGSDYTATSGSLTFAPGQTTATVDVPVAGDTTVEPTENFSLVVTPTEVIVGGASDAVGVATILDDDAGGSARPTLSVADASIREGTSTDSVMNFVVTLSAPSLSDVTFTYQTFSGTAQSGDDFSGKSGTGKIPAGQTSATIGITTAHDGTDETDQNFTLELTNPKNAPFAGNATALRANGVILDDDGTGSNLALFVSNPILLEGAGGSALARFDVTLSRPAATAITVPYTTADGSATAGSDYTATSGSLTFAPGQTTATVDVPVAGDTTVEPTENFSLVVTPTEVIVGGASDAVGVATILDDDAGGSARPTLSVADASIREGTSTDSVMNFVVTLSAPSLSVVTFTYQTFSGTAQSGDDFSGKSGTGTIPAGQTSATIGITTAHDGTDETDQNFTLELTNPKNATFAGNATALRANGVILDDDGTGSNLALFVSNPILLEGNVRTQAARFTLSLSRPSDTATTVSYATVDGSATVGSDYAATRGSLTFAPGQTTATVDVPVLAGAAGESSENFSLVATPGVSVVAPATGLATILPSSSTGLLGDLNVDQQLELIYIAYFNRSADDGGSTFWGGQNSLAQTGGQSAATALTNIANSFTPQPETVALYPFLGTPNLDLNSPAGQAGLTTFVNSLYGNLFGHAPDNVGQTYWVGQLTSGAVGLGAAALAIANGATGNDAIEVLNKISVATNFTIRTAAAGLGQSAPLSAAFLTNANGVLSGVDGVALNDASVTAGINATTAFIGVSSAQIAAPAIIVGDAPITIAISGATIDPGPGNHTIQFLTGATDDTLVLRGGGVDQVSGFDPGSDILDLRMLLSTASGDPSIGVAALNNYVTVVDQGPDALLNFDPAGHAGGGTIAVLQGLATTITGLDGLLANGAIRTA